VAIPSDQRGKRYFTRSKRVNKILRLVLVFASKLLDLDLCFLIRKIIKFDQSKRMNLYEICNNKFQSSETDTLDGKARESKGVVWVTNIQKDLRFRSRQRTLRSIEENEPLPLFPFQME
jgi:hypothetical protein